MAGWLAIDYGEKRVGLAYADELGVPVPLPALPGGRDEQTLAALQQVIQQRQPDALVVGYPYNMDGSIGFKAREVDAFVERLQQVFAGPVERVDETLSSERVKRKLSLREERRLRSSGVIDSAAAALILRDYLDERGWPALAMEEEEF